VVKNKEKGIHTAVFPPEPGRNLPLEFLRMCGSIQKMAAAPIFGI
jgi:hypothetical protein